MQHFEGGGGDSMGMVIKRLLFGLLIALSLAGCGQKGPLYYPDEEEQEEEQETRIEPSRYLV